MAIVDPRFQLGGMGSVMGQPQVRGAQMPTMTPGGVNTSGMAQNLAQGYMQMKKNARQSENSRLAGLMLMGDPKAAEALGIRDPQMRMQIEEHQRIKNAKAKESQKTVAANTIRARFTLANRLKKVDPMQHQILLNDALQSSDPYEQKEAKKLLNLKANDAAYQTYLSRGIAEGEKFSKLIGIYNAKQAAGAKPHSEKHVVSGGDPRVAGLGFDSKDRVIIRTEVGSDGKRVISEAFLAPPETATGRTGKIREPSEITVKGSDPMLADIEGLGDLDPNKIYILTEKYNQDTGAYEPVRVREKVSDKKTTYDIKIGRKEQFDEDTEETFVEDRIFEDGEWKKEKRIIQPLRKKDTEMLKTTAEKVHEMNNDIYRARNLETKIAGLDWSSGVGGLLETKLMDLFGTTSMEQIAKTQFRELSLGEAIKRLPDGPATDKDIELVRSGGPKDWSNKKAVLSYLAGVRKIKQLEKQYYSFQNKWVSDYSNLEKANKSDKRNGSIIVRKGEDYISASQRNSTINGLINNSNEIGRPYKEKQLRKIDDLLYKNNNNIRKTFMSLAKEVRDRKLGKLSEAEKKRFTLDYVFNSLVKKYGVRFE